MSRLTKRSEDLFATARGLDAPSEAERARMRRAVGRRVAGVVVGAAITGAGAETAARVATSAGATGVAAGSGGVGAGMGIVTASSGPLALLGKLAMPLVLAGALGGGVLAVRTARAPRVIDQAVSAPSAATSLPRALEAVVAPSARSTVALSEPASPDVVSAPPPSAPPSSPSAALRGSCAAARPTPARSHLATALTPSSLAAEIALLQTAQDALRRGDATTALSALDESERRFPHPVMGEERLGARVVALCAAGRKAEAAPLAASFRASHPSSPLSRRIDAMCD